MPNRFASVLIASVLASASAAVLAQPAAPPASAKPSASTTVAPVTVQARHAQDDHDAGAAFVQS